MAKGKHFDYLWSTKKEETGYVWKIWGKNWLGVLESSTDNTDEEDKYFETETAARTDCFHAIRDHYN